MIKSLSNLSKEDSVTFGEKSVFLGQAMKFGFPVPKGFAISKDNFEIFMNENGAEIVDLINTVNPDDMNSIVDISKRIRYLFDRYELPEELKKTVRDHYEKLKIDKESYGDVNSDAFNFIKAGRDDPLVSVRISTRSNSNKRYTNIINVKQDVKIFSSIKKVWSSVYSPYSILYHVTKRIPFPKPAIIIQEMVNSAKSGESFSINPITRDRDQSIIQIKWGFNMKNSDSQNIYFVNSSGIIKSYENDFDSYFTQDPQSGITAQRALEDQYKNVPILTDKESELIYKITKDLENRFGFPIYTEFSISKRKLKLLQVSPMTNYLNSNIEINSNVKYSGIKVNSGFLSNYKYFEEFSPNKVLEIINSGGSIFADQDLTSFGSSICKDFEKPCVIKAKIIHSEEKEFESETLEFFGEQNSDEFSNLRTLLEELELELVNLNLTFSQKRKDGLEIDLNKAKLISELEWEIRDIKSRINSE